MPSLDFSAGTLTLRGFDEGSLDELSGVRWDRRSAAYRAPARAYAPIVRALKKAGQPFEDRARGYSELESELVLHRTARPYQREALAAWRAGQHRGVVVLPTGAGKSHVAVLAIADRRRSALVIAPTLDLVRQWYDLMRLSFGCDVGIVGGGEHEVLPLTVATYDSAYLHMQDIGARFGLVVFDECHHLPGETYALAAELCLAPFRLGLTATPERADGREERLDELVGPIVYRRRITELSGEFLADYVVERIEVELGPEERREYEVARSVYLAFVKGQGIRLGSPSGWQDFIMRSARSTEGQRAFAAYRRQRELAFAAKDKLCHVELLLGQHRGDRVIIFTQDNATAYAVSRAFLLPIITHQTKIKERSEILGGFADGSYTAIVTSKVLNEGVDVPEASVAIVLSGSGSVREHVQRLGRILRRHGDKRAVLYELVSAGTAETRTSERRREHEAYQ